MLDSLRRGAASWLVKILLGLLVVSFAAWGIGDMFRIRTPNWVAKVGEREIDRETVYQAFRREVQKLQQMFGRGLDNEQARRLGLLDQTVKQLVGGALLDQEAHKLRMDISEAALAQAIEANPAFRNSLGRFDRFQFEQMLRANGFNEKTFLATLRRDMLREHLQGTVQVNGSVPGEAVDRLFRHQMEQRVADLVIFRNAAQGEVGEPDAAALAQFHKDNAQRFTAPELRAVTVVTLTAADLAKTVTVTDEQAKEEYDGRVADFTREETRDLEQIVVAEEAKAKQAHEKLGKGEDFAAVAKEVAGLSPGDIVFDSVRKRDLPGELSAKVFALTAGALSEPLQSPLGWHVVRVKTVHPGSTEPFEQVRDQLKQALALQQGGDQAAKASRKLEDELAGGGALEEAAAKFGLPVIKLAALDASGHDADGNPVTALPDMPEVVPTAFQTQPGAEAKLHDSANGGYFVLRVDAITPPALRPLESVKADAIAAWQEDRREQAARAKATQALEQLNAGKSLDEIARALGGERKTTEPFVRSGQGAGAELSQPLLVALFALGQGQATAGPNAAKDAHVLARVAEIKPAEADQTAVQRLKKQMADAMGLDLLQQFNQVLEKTYPVTIDRKQLETLF